VRRIESKTERGQDCPSHGATLIAAGILRLGCYDIENNRRGSPMAGQTSERIRSFLRKNKEAVIGVLVAAGLFTFALLPIRNLSGFEISLYLRRIVGFAAAGGMFGALVLTELTEWKRRRWRFSLRTMLIVMGVIAVILWAILYL
jgi:hypothetical protein